MRDQIISIFCLLDDILKGIHHEEDKRRKVSDSNVCHVVWLRSFLCCCCHASIMLCAAFYLVGLKVMRVKQRTEGRSNLLLVGQ